ncbi:tetratricopeptide repeat protein [Opitutus sp. GAS368]|jgi:tetratricopeptide (TPR) repeat protein|uniref:tetratricopeptide repeat protein n=1 Tax=Opitutus sp. GAS368 TaxID=1882749 RepID=UPI00087A5DAD|nr:tetratricopeptide repeat protein [Opitutus sp. GAS368]SDR88572.1 Tetratricopeptide (TPR) repeat [Opitutus sp. GAS368]
MIALAIIAAYWNSLSGPFVFDDLPAIVDNPTIRHLARLGDVLRPPNDGCAVTGRPLLNLTFALNYAWGGTDPRGYHISNLLIHLLAGLTLFGLVRRTLLKPVFHGRFSDSATLLAATTALLWAVHPLQTESVTLVVQRSESLMGLCYLAALYFFSRAMDATAAPKGWLLLTVACCALGMACKEVMATAPFMVLLYDRTFVAGTFREALQRRRPFYIGLFAAWLPLFWLVAGGGGTRGAGAGLGLGVSWWSYALKQCEAVVLYLRLSCWPHPLILDYGVDVVNTIRPVAPQALTLLFLIAGTLVALRRRPALGFLGAWFFVILMPSSSIVPLIGQTVAEHRMYLPLAAVVAAVVLGLFGLLGKGSFGVFAVLVLACGGLTVQRNEDYRDAVTLWRDTALKQRDNYRAHYNLAVELARMPGGHAEAISEYEKSLQLQPSYAEAHNNLAIELARFPGREDEALRHYQTALQLRPDFADAHYNLAIELGKRPDGAAEAITHYETALRLRPGYAEAHNNLAVELAKIPGRLPLVIEHYKAALQAQPDYPEAHHGLANALAMSPERLPEAVAHYEMALRLRPDYVEAHYSLAAVLAQLPGRTSEAIAHYESVLRLRPDHFYAHYNLANELAKLPPRLPEAIAHYETAVRLKPDFLEARNNLAGAYYRSGRLDDAIQQLTVVLQLNPGNRNAQRNLEMMRRLLQQP